MQKQKIIFWALFIFSYSFSCFASEIRYTDTAQNFGEYISKAMFGDLDDDGDIDIFVNHFDYQPNKVWLNDGSGYFSDSGQSLGSAYSVGIDLSDLDGDGDLDAFVGNFFLFNNQNEVWLNDGSGYFSDSGQRLGNAWTTGVALGDLDSDGDADAFVANTSADEIWLNDGSGKFSDSGQRLGPTPSNEVKLGDLDGDGDQDAFVVNVQYSPNKVWLNSGSGNFVDSGQNLGFESSTDVGLGDVDGDGDLDVFVANYDPAPNLVWLNDGSGYFSDSGQRLGNSKSLAVSLGDLDNDGALDAAVVNEDGSNEIWLNDGNGNFTLSTHDNIGRGSGMACARIGHLDDTSGPDRLLSTAGHRPAVEIHALQDNHYPDLLLSTEVGISIFLASLDEEGCVTNEDCDEGYVCVNGLCVEDDRPSLGAGPFVAAGAWPQLSTSSASPTYVKSNTGILWTFSDDFASCSEDCTHSAEYSVAGSGVWIPITVSSEAENGYAWVDLPVESLENATTYAFRFAVTDCAVQTTSSGEYYFRVATSDAPPVITGGPWLAAGSWPALPASAAKAVVLNQDRDVLWTFSDDYASCSGLCTHRARYRKVGDTVWTWLTPVNTDPAGDWYANTTLPVESLETGTYQFYFDVRDCAGQRTFAPKVYYFKVE